MSIGLDEATPEAIGKSVEKVRQLMETLWQALDALAEGVSISAVDDVRQLLALRSSVVPHIDARLATCGELLRHGLRSEALGRAAEFPPLVETANLLDLASHPQWADWQLALSAQEIPAPVLPRLDLVKALVKAQDECEALKPLLGRWRRMNLANASLPERIGLLRKLRKQDSNCEVWFEALREHEKQRLGQIEVAIKQATRDRDERRLQGLVEEMDAGWKEPVDSRLKQAAAAALASFRGSRIDREIDEVGGSLAAAHEARDLDAARELRRRWGPLADEKGSLEPGDPRLAAADPAVAWVDNHDRMRGLAEEVWQSLDAKPRGLRAWREWVRSLDRMGAEMEDLAEKLSGEVDEEAVQRTHERIARKREELTEYERFRRRLMYIGTGSVAALLAVGVWYIDDDQRFKREVAAAIEQLDNHMTECRNGLLTALPDVDGYSSRVRGAPSVAGRIVSLEAALKKEDDRRRNFAEYLGQAREALAAAAERPRNDRLQAWPPEFAEATRALEELEKRAWAKTEAEKADLFRAQGDIDKLAKSWTSEADLELGGRLSAIDARLDHVREILAGDLAAAEAGLVEASATIESNRALASAPAVAGAASQYGSRQVASAETVAKFSRQGPLQRKATDLSRMIDERNGFAKEVALLPAALGNWPTYGKVLDRVATGFPDLAEAAEFAEAAQRRPQWEAIDRWREFAGSLEPLGEVKQAKAKQLVELFGQLPQTVRDLPMARTFAVDVLPALEHFSKRDLEGLEANLATFLNGPFMAELAFVVTTAAGGDIFYCLAPKPESGKPFDFVAGMKTNQVWPLKKERADALTVEASPQAQLAQRLAGRVRLAGKQDGLAIDAMLLGIIKDTIAAKAVDPILRLVAVRKYLLLGEEFSLPIQVDGRAALRLVSDGKGGIPGIDLRDLGSFAAPTRQTNVTYLTTTKTAQRLVEEIAEMLPALEVAIAAERKRLDNPKGLLPAVTGVIGLASDGTRIPVWKEGKPPAGEVWWIASPEEVAKAGRALPDGTFQVAKPPPPAGTPLWQFGP